MKHFISPTSVDHIEFRKHYLFFNILICIPIFFLSYLLVYFNKSHQISLASYLLLFFIIASLLINFFFSKHILINGWRSRILSIDPEIQGKRKIFIFFFIILNSPILVIPAFIFLSLAKPNSLRGKLGGILTKALLLPFIFLLILIYSFWSTLQNKDLNPTNIASKAAWYISSPAVYYIALNLEGISNLQNLRKTQFDNFEQLFAKTQPICRSPLPHFILTTSLTLDMLKTDKQFRKTQDNEKIISVLDKVISTLNNCNNSWTSPSNYNPIWLLIPGNSLQASMVLLTDIYLQYGLFKNINRMFYKKITKVRKDPNFSQEVIKLEKRFKQTPAYLRFQSINNSIIGSLIGT